MKGCCYIINVGYTCSTYMEHMHGHVLCVTCVNLLSSVSSTCNYDCGRQAENVIEDSLYAYTVSNVARTFREQNQYI